MTRTRMLFCALAAVAGTTFFAGCGNRQVEEALDSDANGYVCTKCETKFYTDRKMFPTYCPKCKDPGIQQVLGFVCETDKHVTLGPRGRGAYPCEKCGKVTTALSLPREADLKAWGAVKKDRAEVGG